eukprot:TRINITY_DN4785_c0_g1::TRINITY_DN4785_c0_g1_i1::g.21275::m.21275 TRINITY_DN4785_c0_g1::TRINITY_DN4785_c0_g1_i1::g.21275  ORF type:complete len:193 (-),score=14.32,GRAM/PF02893.15/4e-10,Spore_YtfJ/PF09579.5/1 TRINITY_DN4785_c0_g1_i1:132-674(-)
MGGVSVTAGQGGGTSTDGNDGCSMNSSKGSPKTSPVGVGVRTVGKVVVGAAGVAGTYVQALLGAENSATLSRMFGIPANEVIRAKYRAMDKEMRSGRLYVTSNFLCFYSYVSLKPVVVSLKEIAEIEKIGGRLQILDNGILLTLHDLRTLAFYGFVNRSNVIFDIYKQAQEVGYKIVLRS